MFRYGSDLMTRSFSGSEFSSSDSIEKKRNYAEHLATIHLAGLHLLLSMTVFGAGIYLELQWMTEYSCHTYYTLIYIRCVYWIITYIFDTLITHRHNVLRRQGYHDFYRYKILTYKNVPFNVVTLWNMILLVGQTAMIEYYGSDFNVHCQKSMQSPISYLCLFSGLETILLMIVHGSYIMKVWHFNALNSLPDALRDIEQPFMGSLGITMDNEKIGDLLEKQADLIYYLKEQNTHLNRKVLQLSQKHHKFESYEPI